MSLDVKVEIAFTTDPDSTTPEWTDVSAYVDVAAGLSITRGRADLDEDTQPSTASWVFDNSDGRFTAGLSSSPYYPNVVLGRRVRISMRKDAGTWRTRFDGMMDAWPTQWAPTGRYAEATVTAVDRRKRLGRHILTDNVVSATILQDHPVDYWPLGDAEATTSPANRTGDTVLRPAAIKNSGSAITFGSADGVGTDGGLNAVEVTDWGFDASSGAYYPFDPATGDGVTFEACLKITSWQVVPVWLAATDIKLDPDASAPFFQVDVDGTLNAIYSTHDNTDFTTLSTTATVTDGRWHHVAAVFASTAPDSGSITIYLDGVQVAQTVPGVTSIVFSKTPNPAPLSLALYLGGIAPNPSSQLFAHLAAYNTALAADRIKAHALAAGLYAGDESTTDRWNRLVDLGQLPAEFYATLGAAGTIRMGPLKDVGGSSLEALFAAAAAAESGLQYVDTTGVVTLRTRAQDYNQAPLVTLQAGQYGGDLTFLLDDHTLLNDVTATSANGTTARYTDAASVTAYGTYSASLDVDTLDDAMAEVAAITRVVRSQPAPRCSQVSIDLLTQQDLADTLWSTELLGAVITLDGLPATAPATSRYEATYMPTYSALAVDVQVQGYTETFSLTECALNINATPALASVWELGDAALGKLGTTTRLAY